MDDAATVLQFISTIFSAMQFIVKKLHPSPIAQHRTLGGVTLSKLFKITTVALNGVLVDQCEITHVEDRHQNPASVRKRLT